MCILYVDDLIFWENNEYGIHDIAMKMRELGIDLEQEDDAGGFLLVNLDCYEDTGFIEMNKVRLIHQVIDKLGLGVGTTKGNFTPAEDTTLVKYENGEAEDVTFSDSSVDGMLLYLYEHTHPDVSFYVNFCA